jgi:fucose permease
MPLSPTRRRDVGALLGGAGLLLVGWASLLAPALIRSIEADFGQTDAGMGVWFLVNSLGYVTGSLVGGFLTERIGRRVVLSLGALLMAVGLAAFASVPTWSLALLAAVPFGIGGGVLDGGSNGLILDLYPTSRGRALNLLHLAFSLGAFASPLVAGQLVERGVAWQTIVLGTAVAAVPLAALYALADLPSGRHRRAAGTRRTVRIGLAWPLVALAVAIGCYVGSEVGVSTWLVQFLETASVGLATSALSLFWGCLALGRLASARWSDRFDHARFAAIAAIISAIALVAAVIVPSLPASIVLFGVVGFAYGPVYPLIMAVAGDRYPTRSAAVSGFLAGMAVTGSILYPPFMGFLSVEVGLGPAMTGAAVLAFASGVALLLVGRARSAALAVGSEAAARPVA